MFFCIVMLFCGPFAAGAQDIPVAPHLPAVQSAQAQNAPITLQFPQEKASVLPGAQNIYLFGKINLPNPTLQINGQKVPLYHNGTFLTFLPVQQGEFSFLMTAQSQGKTYQAVRNIIVPGVPLQHFTAKARFDETEIYPKRPLWVLPGDIVLLSARGTPGAKVKARIHGVKGAKNIELKENVKKPGLYQARFFIRETEKPRLAKVTYFLQDPATKTKAKIHAPQRIKILDKNNYLIPAQVTDPGVKLRQLPVHQGSLFPYYRTFGRVLVGGRENGLYRIHLGNGERAWLEESKLKLISADRSPRNEILELNTYATPQKTNVHFSLTQQVPVSVHEFNNRMEIIFYYTPSFDENFNFDATSTLLERIEWEEPKDGVLKFILYFKPNTPLWGHAYRYQGSTFELDLHHAVQTAPLRKKPLNGARILIDAGHSPKRTPPYDGMVTPSGILEYELNLALAETLKPKLEKAGAEVIMTRSGQNHISLPKRYQKALQENAHIFVSLHYNALPDTINPLAAPRGYSVYYTYPHSFALAESVYKSFNKRVPLPDNGLIANDILFIPRISEMPSILIENAFPILPEQEEFVQDPKGWEILAQAIFQGILDFYKNRPSAH